MKENLLKWLQEQTLDKQICIGRRQDLICHNKEHKILHRISLVGMTEGLPICLLNDKITIAEKWSSLKRCLVEYSCNGRRKEDFMKGVFNSRRKLLV